MSLLVDNFIMIFLNPFKNHLELTKLSSLNFKDKRSLVLADSLSPLDWDNESGEVRAKTLGLADVIICCWPFVLVKNFWKLLSLYLGVLSFHYLKQEIAYDWSYISPLAIKAQSFMTIYALLEIVFFPLYVWLYSKIWTEVIRLSHFLFKDASGGSEKIAQVVNHSFVSNLFLIIPIFGEVIQTFASVFYLYAGLRCNLEYSRWQSSVTLLGPLIFFFILLSISLLFIGFLMTFLFT